MLLTFVVIYLLASRAVGLIAATRVHTAKDFIEAGRSLPFYVVTATVFATWFGSETVLGISSTFIKDGLGGIVSDPASFNQVLARCTTVWLRADPADHMNRVAAQGDTRPMAASREAMEDLKRILSGRAAFYSKADLQLDTSRQDLERTFQLLLGMVRERLGARGADMQFAA